MPAMNMSLPSNLPADQAALLGAIFGAMDFSAFTAVPDHNDDLKITAYQPLTGLAPLGAYASVASDAAELGKLGYEVTRDQITLFLGSSYFGALLAQKRVRTLEKALEQVDRLLTDGRNMMAQGLITKADLLKFEMRYSEVKIQLLQARQDSEQARSYLAKLLDLPLDQVTPEDPAVTIDKLEDLPWYVDRGERDRRELRMATLQEDIAGATRTAAYLNLIPQVGAVASADWNDDGLDTTPDRTYAAGFALSWNFWGLGSDVLKARAASYAKEKAVHEARATRLDIHAGIEKSWRDAQVAHETVEVAKQTLAQAEENFRIEQNRYKAGKSTATDLLGAQTQLTSSETGYYAALYGAALSDAGLAAAIGRKPFSAVTGGSHE
jgi:outer membrane protein TolC